MGVIFEETYSRSLILYSSLAMTCHGWLGSVITKIGGMWTVGSVRVGYFGSDLVSMYDRSSFEVSISELDEFKDWFSY